MSKAEHGIESAYYSNGPYGLRPVMICLCGFGTSRGSDSWEESGREFDEHLSENRPEAREGNV